MVTVAGHISIGSVSDLLGIVVYQMIPNRFPLTVLVPSSLDLIRRCTYAKLKSFREPTLSVCQRQGAIVVLYKRL